MKQLSLLCSMTFILLCPLSIAAQVDFPSVDAFLKSTLQGEAQVADSANGDLNGDGLADWAGVVHRRPSDSSPTYQLYVLLRLPGGGFHLAEKSIEEEIPGMGCCWMESLEIRRGSIYIQNNAKDASVMEAVRHQFKLNKGQWRLVGINSYQTNHETSVDHDKKMNLLTGLVIEKRQKGDRKPVTKTRRQKFATYLLKDFDFSIRFANED